MPAVSKDEAFRVWMQTIGPVPKEIREALKKATPTVRDAVLKKVRPEYNAQFEKWYPRYNAYKIKVRDQKSGFDPSQGVDVETPGFFSAAGTLGNIGEKVISAPGDLLAFGKSVSKSQFGEMKANQLYRKPGQPQNNAAIRRIYEDEVEPGQTAIEKAKQGFLVPFAIGEDVPPSRKEAILYKLIMNKVATPDQIAEYNEMQRANTGAGLAGGGLAVGLQMAVPTARLVKGAPLATNIGRVLKAGAIEQGATLAAKQAIKPDIGRLGEDIKYGVAGAVVPAGLVALGGAARGGAKLVGGIKGMAAAKKASKAVQSQVDDLMELVTSVDSTPELRLTAARKVEDLVGAENMPPAAQSALRLADEEDALAGVMVEQAGKPAQGGGKIGRVSIPEKEQGLLTTGRIGQEGLRPDEIKANAIAREGQQATKRLADEDAGALRRVEDDVVRRTMELEKKKQTYPGAPRDSFIREEMEIRALQKEADILRDRLGIRPQPPAQPPLSPLQKVGKKKPGKKGPTLQSHPGATGAGMYLTGYAAEESNPEGSTLHNFGTALRALGAGGMAYGGGKALLGATRGKIGIGRKAIPSLPTVGDVGSMGGVGDATRMLQRVIDDIAPGERPLAGGTRDIDVAVENFLANIPAHETRALAQGLGWSAQEIDDIAAMAPKSRTMGASDSRTLLKAVSEAHDSIKAPLPSVKISQQVTGPPRKTKALDFWQGNVAGPMRRVLEQSDSGNKLLRLWDDVSVRADKTLHSEWAQTQELFQRLKKESPKEYRQMEAFIEAGTEPPSELGKAAFRSYRASNAAQTMRAAKLGVQPDQLKNYFHHQVLDEVGEAIATRGHGADRKSAEIFEAVRDFVKKKYGKEPESWEEFGTAIMREMSTPAGISQPMKKRSLNLPQFHTYKGKTYQFRETDPLKAMMNSAKGTNRKLSTLEVYGKDAFVPVTEGNPYGIAPNSELGKALNEVFAVHPGIKDKVAKLNQMHLGIGLDAADGPITTQTLRNIQAGTKLPLAVFSNLMQTMQTVGEHGVSNTAKAMATKHLDSIREMVGSPVSPAGKALKESGALMTGLMEKFGITQRDTMSSKFADLVLRGSGFKAVEMGNWTNAALATFMKMSDAARMVNGKNSLWGRVKTGRLWNNDPRAVGRQMLKKYGLTDVEINGIAKTGTIPEETMDYLMQRGIQRTQFKSLNPSDVPYVMTLPAGKLLGQFRGFSANYGSWVLDNVKTHAKNGDVPALLTLASGLGLAGWTREKIMDALNDREKGHPSLLGQFLYDIYYAGAFGLIGDVGGQYIGGPLRAVGVPNEISSGRKIGFQGLFNGPTLSDLSNVFQFLNSRFSSTDTGKYGGEPTPQALSHLAQDLSSLVRVGATQWKKRTNPEQSKVERARRAVLDAQGDSGREVAEAKLALFLSQAGPGDKFKEQRDREAVRYVETLKELDGESLEDNLRAAIRYGDNLINKKKGAETILSKMSHDGGDEFKELQIAGAKNAARLAATLANAGLLSPEKAYLGIQRFESKIEDWMTSEELEDMTEADREVVRTFLEDVAKAAEEEYERHRVGQ